MDFDVAVFTNATEENLFSGGGVMEPEAMDAHVAKMARLFGSLNDPDRQRAIINVDGAHLSLSFVPSLVGRSLGHAGLLSLQEVPCHRMSRAPVSSRTQRPRLS